MFETEFSGPLANPEGDDAEADYWLNTPLADASGWGTAALEDDWQGLGSNEPAKGLVIDGFAYTKDAGNNDGTFTFSDSLLDEYDQFALAVKDGAKPKFAICMLPVGLRMGNWHFLTSGELGHFALYMHVTPLTSMSSARTPVRPVHFRSPGAGDSAPGLEADGPSRPGGDAPGAEATNADQSRAPRDLIRNKRSRVE